MNHAQQLDAVGVHNIENAMGLGGEAANPLLPNFRPFSAHLGLLGDVGDDVVEPPQVFIRAGFPGVSGDVAPNPEQILLGARPADDTRHGYTRR